MHKCRLELTECLKDLVIIAKMIYPEGRVNLEYSEKQRLFHFSYDPKETKTSDWVSLGIMANVDAILFSELMDKKFRSDMLPELTVIKFELAVYFELLDL